MDTLQILCALRDALSFAWVFPSDLLPHSIAHACTVIINVDPPYVEGFALAVCPIPAPNSRAPINLIRTECHLLSFPPCTTSYVTTAPPGTTTGGSCSGLTSEICGTYCCLFALHAGRGYGPRQIVGLLNAGEDSVRQIERAFLADFGPLRPGRRGVQCSCSRL